MTIVFKSGNELQVTDNVHKEVVNKINKNEKGLCIFYNGRNEIIHIIDINNIDYSY